MKQAVAVEPVTMSKRAPPGNGVSANEPRQADELLPRVYDDLRRLAAARIARENEGQTLQATALVHEVWLRLVHAGPVEWKTQAQFFAAAAEAMRRILIERARRKARLKHGGGLVRVDFRELNTADRCPDEQLLAVDEALKRLAAQDSQAAELIELRFFAGLTNAQAAEVLSLSERTAKRLWAYARAWLYRELNPRG